MLGELPYGYGIRLRNLIAAKGERMESTCAWGEEGRRLENPRGPGLGHGLRDATGARPPRRDRPSTVATFQLSSGVVGKGCSRTDDKVRLFALFVEVIPTI